MRILFQTCTTATTTKSTRQVFFVKFVLQFLWVGPDGSSCEGEAKLPAGLYGAGMVRVAMGFVVCGGLMEEGIINDRVVQQDLNCSGGQMKRELCFLILLFPLVSAGGGT